MDAVIRVLTCAALAALLPLAAQAQPAFGRLTIVAPAAPGGGWDQLAREMQRELERARLASVQVENVPGAAGTIGLAQFLSDRRGDGRSLLVGGLVMLGATIWNQSPVSIAQVTPIARLTGEHEIVAVPAASPHRTLQSLVDALRASPAGVSWGGGSAGGTDHVLAGLILAAAGLDPRQTNFIPFSGGGEAVAALLGGQVTAGISGYSEFGPHVESGRLRVLAVSAPRRSSALPEVPTLVEQGLAVELENWRAVMAPPGLGRSERDRLVGLVERLVRSDAWRETLSRLRWTDSYLAGPAFDAFLDDERVRIARIVSSLRGAGGDTPSQRAGEWAFPALVLAGALFVVLRFVFVRNRGRVGRGVPARPAANSAALARAALALVAFVALAEPAGFVAAGTVLFALTASAFGSRRSLRDAMVGAALCALVYGAFTWGLDIPLPRGAWS
jgi:putative tricarboxylic transport membrane protein